MATIPEIVSKWTDNNGTPLPFAKLYSYAAGSSVPKALYSDYDCTIPLSNPLIADASGKFREFFLASGRYRFGLHDQLDALIDTRDDVDASGASGGNPGTVTSVQLVLGASLDVAAQVTSLPVTDAGNIDLEWRNQPARKALMSPEGSSGKPVFRDIVWADIIGTSPYLPLAGGTMDNDVTVVFPKASGGNTYQTEISNQNVFLRKYDSFGAEIRSIDADIEGGDGVSVEVAISNTTSSIYDTRLIVQNATKKTYVYPSQIQLVNNGGAGNTTILDNTIGSPGLSIIIPGGDGSEFTDFWSVFHNSDYSIRSQLDKSRLQFNVSGSTAVFEPSQFNLVNGNSSILGSASTSAGVDIAVTSGGGDATCVTRRVGFATTQNGTTMFSTTSGAVTAADFNLSSQVTNFVGQDFDIRNGKSLLLAGVPRITTGGAGSFTGLTSTGGATISNFVTMKAVSGTSDSGIAITSLADLSRWAIYKDSSPESGSNAGSNFAIRAYTDAGADNGIVVYCPRVAGANFEVRRPLAVTTGKITFAASTTSYPSATIPTGTAPTVKNTGDVWSDGGTFWVQGLGLGSGRGASDTITIGSYLSLTDAYATTKGWLAQLGASNTLDFWNYASSTWTKRIQFSSAGGIGFFGVAAPTTRPTVNAACTDLATCIALTNQLRTHLIACGLVQ